MLSLCSVSVETESVSSIEQESTSLPEDCQEDTDFLCSQSDSDKGEGSDRWNWAEYFFAGHSQFDLKEPEVIMGLQVVMVMLTQMQMKEYFLVVH